MFESITDALREEIMILDNRIRKGSSMLSVADRDSKEYTIYFNQLEHLKIQMAKANTCLNILNGEGDCCILPDQNMKLCQLKDGIPKSGDCMDCAVYKQIKIN